MMPRKLNGKLQWITFATNGTGVAIAYWKGMNLEANFTACTEINSKGIKDLSVSTKMITLLEKIITLSLSEIALVNGFLAITPKAQQYKNWLIGLHQNKKWCVSKGHYQEHFLAKNKKENKQKTDDLQCGGKYLQDT